MEKYKVLNSLELKLVLILLMFLDHLYESKIISCELATIVGRIAFPVFAFLIVEGFFYTKDFKRYLARILFFAILSELPYNFVFGKTLFFPDRQNVLFTFFIALIAIELIKKSKKKGEIFYTITFLFCMSIGFALGYLIRCSYRGAGILTVLLFYFFRDKKYRWIGILAGLLYINCSLLGEPAYSITVLGLKLEIPLQFFVVFSLIPILMYNGKKGFDSRIIQYFFYAFYPAHLLFIGVLAKIIS